MQFPSSPRLAPLPAEVAPSGNFRSSGRRHSFWVAEISAVLLPRGPIVAPPCVVMWSSAGHSLLPLLVFRGKRLENWRELATSLPVIASSLPVVDNSLLSRSRRSMLLPE